MTHDPGLTPEQEERLARYRAGALAPAEREAFERELLASDALAEALYGEESLQAVVADAAPGRVLEAPVARRAAAPRRWLDALPRYVLPAAAVLAVVAGTYALLGPRRAGPPGDEMVRGAEGTSRPLAPIGRLEGRPERFVWTRDPAAASYRVELFAADGTPLGTLVTADTTLAIGSLADSSLAAAEWRVVPLDEDGLERAALPRVAFERSPR